MTYFGCYVVGSWMFAIGWFLGAIQMQNHPEETESPAAKEPEKLEPEREAWGLSMAASSGAD
jgi:hypothetical protein